MAASQQGVKRAKPFQPIRKKALQDTPQPLMSDPWNICGSWVGLWSWAFIYGIRIAGATKRMIKYAMQQEGEDRVASRNYRRRYDRDDPALLGLLELRRDLWQGFDLVKRCGEALLGIFLD